MTATSGLCSWWWAAALAAGTAVAAFGSAADSLTEVRGGAEAGFAESPGWYEPATHFFEKAQYTSGAPGARVAAHGAEWLDVQTEPRWMAHRDSQAQRAYVPEPGTLVLILAGGALCGPFRGRRC